MVIDVAGVRTRGCPNAPVAEELPTGGSGLGRYRGPVGRTNLLGAGAHLKHGPAAPTLSRTVHPSSAPGCSYVLLRQLISRFWHRLHFLSGNLPTCHGITFSLPAASSTYSAPGGTERREIVIEPNGVYNFECLDPRPPVFCFFAWLWTM